MRTSDPRSIKIFHCIIFPVKMCCHLTLIDFATDCISWRWQVHFPMWIRCWGFETSRKFSCIRRKFASNNSSNAIKILPLCHFIIEPTSIFYFGCGMMTGNHNCIRQKRRKSDHKFALLILTYSLNCLLKTLSLVSLLVFEIFPEYQYNEQI